MHWHAELDAVRLRNGREFKKIFEYPIEKFWSNTHGFDLLKFDTFVGVPKGFSLNQAIKAKYGKRASDFIRQILNEEKAAING